MLQRHLTVDARNHLFQREVEHAGDPGDGRQVTFRMLHIFEFRDGRISRENVWMDTASVLAQLSRVEMRVPRRS